LKKLTAILFLSAYLFSATADSKLLEVNKFVQPSEEIKAIDSTVTFLHFPVTHYLQDKLNNHNKQFLLKSAQPNIPNSFQALDIFLYTQRFDPAIFHKTVLPIIFVDLVASKRSKLVWHPPNTITARACLFYS